MVFGIFWLSGIQYLVIGIWYLVSGIWYFGYACVTYATTEALYLFLTSDPALPLLHPLRPPPHFFLALHILLFCLLSPRFPFSVFSLAYPPPPPDQDKFYLGFVWTLFFTSSARRPSLSLSSSLLL